MKPIRAWPGTAAAAFGRWRPVARAGGTWIRRVNVRLACAGLVAAASVGAVLLTCGAVHYIYVDRRNLPDLEPFTRFEFSTIGHIYDTHGRPLIQLAREYRQIAQYTDIPPIVRDAILATEDRRFFFHNGVDYYSIPRVLGKVRVGGPVMFPQGGSTITQQLVRGVFLRGQTAAGQGDQRRTARVLSRVLSAAIGDRNAKMVLRKGEEIRLTLWVEQQMRERFGSKRRAKEEILARYASFVYMGDGQYGFARAAEHYFGRPLATFTADDADKAALLAGIMKAPRDYAPTAAGPERILRRRNQILALMAARGFIARAEMAEAVRRPLPAVVQRASEPFRSSAVVEHVLEELAAVDAGLDIDDLRHGRIQVYTTVDARVQRIASDALEHGLERYERRHPRSARGVVQGSIVVLQNHDGRILGETGGRQVFNGRSASYSDYNRVTRSLRQPGSAMKPIVYLAAFDRSGFTLETLVPDEPIGVRDGDGRPLKWIANYDGRFKGPIPIRQALAESRNAAAMWLAGQIGIDRVLQTSRSLGIRTPLERYPATALGASAMSLLELANAYRTMASGIVAEPYVIRAILGNAGERPAPARRRPRPAAIDPAALSLIQEGLRGVVRLPSGTAHALAVRDFPIAVMGKTGTTNEFRDAIFVGSTYGPDGITAAVRIGFDDNRSLGSRETGGRVALPVFQELLLGVYGDAILGKAPAFPPGLEARITASLLPPDLPVAVDVTSAVAAGEILLHIHRR